jgi:photosystem II stability/assembly factor-like uncharacterized protein
MFTNKYKILLGSLAILLVIAACSYTSSATLVPTLAPVATDTLAPATGLPAATEPVPTDTSPAPATAAPTVISLPPVNSPSINYLDMLDNQNGWALSNGSVLRTTDGGSIWLDATPTGFGSSAASSFFLDANTGWVAVMGTDPTSGTLFRTSDGGINWDSFTVPFGGGSLHFVDAMHGWELIGLNAGMSHESVAIFRTGDGGETWSRVFINEPGAPGSSDSLPLVGDKNGITAVDVDHAWVTGAQPTDDFIYVYTTQDGGTTWSHQDLAIPSGYSPSQTGANLPYFFNSTQGVLPVLLFSNSNGTDFYVSQDGGQHWLPTTPVPQGGFLAVGSPVDFFVWDGGATLYASHDAGATWSTVTPNIDIQKTMISMQFVNAATGWALTGDASGNTVIYRTTDGGLTWNSLNP